MFGGRITALAIPLVAALTLGAAPLQMGMLNAIQILPYLLLALPAGVWMDRVRKRPLMLAANLIRALLLACIPVTYVLGLLGMNMLYACAFGIGACTLIFDLAYQTYLPSLVGTEELVEGNSKLEISRSAAEIAGPGLAGALIGILAAPFAILVHSAMMLISAVSISLIRRAEPAPEPRSSQSFGAEIGAGLLLVFRNPYLKAVAGEAATYNFFSQVTWSVMILYITRNLGMGAAQLGLITGIAGAGSILGSLTAGPLAKRFRLGPVVFGSMLLGCGAPILVLVASDSGLFSSAMLLVSFFLSGAGIVISNIHAVSLRQTVTPGHLLGRMNASYRFVVTGVAPLGALLGGWLGSTFGLQTTLIVGAIGTLLALAWILGSPIPGLSALPRAESDEIFHKTIK
ncbi:hypothetical protein B9G55_19080 [Saccharibacillus sp. O16]|nr:hypothetical protein B9G55_19080 [Saccharibacillus sp. O16]